MNIENIQKVLLECYSKDLCYPKVQDDWDESNKCFGMCAITSLIINDYFGGDICKIHVDEISHYFNLVEDKVIDLTSSQVNHEIDYKYFKIVDRQKILTDDTKMHQNYIPSMYPILVRQLQDTNALLLLPNLCLHGLYCPNVYATIHHDWHKPQLYTEQAESTRACM